jgi:hypothetical protein
MRDKYKERVHIEKMRMLNEILSANEPRDKRAVVARFNPYFYLLFQDGVKRYEQDEQTTEVALRVGSDSEGLTHSQERTH